MEQHLQAAMLLLQVLVICNEYHVRLIGELYARLLKTQLLFNNTSDSSKPGGEIDDVLHSLKCLKGEGDKWALLLDAGDRFALCAVLNKHTHHAQLLQTVQLWLPVKVCARLPTSDLLPSFRFTAAISCLSTVKLDRTLLLEATRRLSCLCCTLFAAGTMYAIPPQLSESEGRFQQVGFAQFSSVTFWTLCSLHVGSALLSLQGCTNAVYLWQVVTEEIWKEAVHAATAIFDKASLLALWQWLAQNQHDWNAPSGAAQVMSAHVLATSKPKQGRLCSA